MDHNLLFDLINSIICNIQPNIIILLLYIFKLLFNKLCNCYLCYLLYQILLHPYIFMLKELSIILILLLKIK